MKIIVSLIALAAMLAALPAQAEPSLVLNTSYSGVTGRKSAG